LADYCDLFGDKSDEKVALRRIYNSNDKIADILKEVK